MSQTLIGPRDENGLPVPVTLDESIAKLKSTRLTSILRSAYVYRVDCGGCNGCEIEIFAAISPLFDAERFGIKVVPSPRHADILLFTGAVTRAMRVPALRAWDSAPDPKICISYGACGNSGGIFHDLYCVWGGTDKIVPVDVYIPGCQQHDETDGVAAALLHPQVPQPLRVLLDREARRMAGYRYGRQIADQFMQLLVGDDGRQVESRIGDFLAERGDLRLNEIIGNLLAIYHQVLRGEVRL